MKFRTRSILAAAITAASIAALPSAASAGSAGLQASCTIDLEASSTTVSVAKMPKATAKFLYIVKDTSLDSKYTRWAIATELALPRAFTPDVATFEVTAYNSKDKVIATTSGTCTL